MSNETSKCILDLYRNVEEVGAAVVRDESKNESAEHVIMVARAAVTLVDAVQRNIRRMNQALRSDDADHDY